MLPVELSCHGCRLRPWRHADKASLIANANSRAIWRNLRDIFPHPYTEADADAWLRYVTGRQPEGTYAVEIAGEAVGGVGLTFGKDIDRLSAEIGYWLGERYWGRGLMTEVVRAVTVAALQEPNVVRLAASVFVWNPASMRVLEKAGYRRAAVLVCGGVKDGAVVDRVLYAVTRQPDGPYTSFADAVPAADRRGMGDR